MATGIMQGLSQNGLARLTGGFYLAFILTAVLADALASIGIGDAAGVFEAITDKPAPFRLGLVTAFVSALLFLLAAWGLYLLLRVVDARLALLFLLLNAVGVALQCASMLPLLAALLLADSPERMESFAADQLQGLAYWSINVYESGFLATQLFFGVWLFPLGYLVYRSRFLPRFLGILLLLDGVGVVVWFLQGLLLPNYDAIAYPGLAISFVAEVALGLWLLVRGVGPPGSSEPRYLGA